VDAIDRAWVRPNLVTYGHSFLAETGLSDPAGYYARQIAAEFGMAYPTSGSSDLKRAVGGSFAESAADVMLTGQPWIPSKQYGSNKVLLIQALINTARKNGADPATRQGAAHALRTMCALGSSLEVIPDTAAFFSYSANWSTVSGAGYHSGECRVTSSPDHFVDFTVPAYGCHFLTTGRKVGLSGAQIQFQRLDTGQVFHTWDNTDQAQADLSRPYVVAAIPLLVPAGTRVRVRLVSGENLVCDGLVVPAPRPGPILLMKEPYLADYSHSVLFPNGSDAALDYFNSILDALALEFPNVIVADPNTAGFWDKTTDILADGVHPNLSGHTALAQTMVAAIRETLEWKSYEAGLYL
jgi:hypothetical protein